MDIVIRSAFSPRDRVREAPDGETLTKQYFKDECDINLILARYNKTQVLEHVSSISGDFLDTSPSDFQESMNLVLAAKADFALLPAEVRKRFGHSPREFFEFASDPSNSDELVKLGLATAPAVLEPTPIPTPTPESKDS